MGCTSWPTTCNSERIRAFQQRAHLGKIVSGKEREARRYGVRDGLVPILRIRVGDLLEHATVDSGYAFSACGMGYEVCWKQPYGVETTYWLGFDYPVNQLQIVDNKLPEQYCLLCGLSYIII